MLINPDLDLSFLYEIADGSDEFIVESIEMFLQQTPDLLQNINNAITAGDWPNAASAAHKLKPNLGFFGMLNSQALLQDIEIQCKAGNPDAADVVQKFKTVNDNMTVNLAELEVVKKEKEAGL